MSEVPHSLGKLLELEGQTLLEICSKDLVEVVLEVEEGASNSSLNSNSKLALIRGGLLIPLEFLVAVEDKILISNNKQVVEKFDY